MIEQARELDSRADDLRDSGSLPEAGYTYTLAAYEYAGASERSFPETSSLDLALRELLYAATCYRIVGDDFQSRNRCEIGSLMAEDHIEYIERIGYDPGSFADVRRGGWPELIGDLRTVAERDDADEAYDRARQIYESAGYWEFVLGEEEHMALAAFFRSVRRGLGHDIPEDAPEQQALDITFEEWLEYKRERLPGLLDELEAQGTWPTE